MNKIVRSLKEKIKKQINKKGWIAQQLRGLPAGIDISYDLSYRLDSPNLLVIFDCGAHKGETAVEYRRRFPSAQIYSFEPIKSNFEFLEKNIKRYNKIYAYNFALGEKEETVCIQLQSDSQTHSLNNRSLGKQDKNSELIKVVTIDSFMSSHNLNKIDLLKIDTEGYEVNVLQGAQQALVNKKITFILAEATVLDDDLCHTNISALSNYLKPYGYKIAAIYDQVIWKKPVRLSYFNVLFSRL